MPVVSKPIEHTGLSPKELIGFASELLYSGQGRKVREKNLHSVRKCNKIHTYSMTMTMSFCY